MQSWMMQIYLNFLESKLFPKEISLDASSNFITSFFSPNAFQKMYFLLSPKYVLQIVLTDVHRLQGYVHWGNGVNSFAPP